MRMKLSRIKNVMNFKKLSWVVVAMSIVLMVALSSGFAANRVNSESEQSVLVPTPAPLSVPAPTPAFQTADEAMTYNIQKVLYPIFGAENVEVTVNASEGAKKKDVDVLITTGLSDPLSTESITAITQIVEGTIAGNGELIYVNVSEGKSAD